jgi:WD40 repeat protein
LSTETGALPKNDPSSISFPTKLETICWSPNGDVLAVSMSNGLLHLLDAQFGKVRYTRHFDDPIRAFRWYSVLPEDESNFLADPLLSGVRFYLQEIIGVVRKVMSFY